MQESVVNQITQSPTWWLDRAIELNVLWPDLKEELTKYEMAYKSEIVDEIEKGKKISEADRYVQAKSENYRLYEYLKGRDKFVEHFINLAKKRAQIEQGFY